MSNSQHVLIEIMPTIKELLGNVEEDIAGLHNLSKNQKAALQLFLDSLRKYGLSVEDIRQIWQK